MAIHIALVGQLEDVGPDMNQKGVVTIVHDLEDPVLLQTMESAGERLIDGFVIDWEATTDHVDYKAAIRVLDSLLTLDPFLKAFEHLLNEARRLGTRGSDHHFCGLGIKARKQFGQTVTDEDRLDDEPARRTHN